MGKDLKLRIYKAITTTLQSCRSKDPSNLPLNPVPSFPPPKLSTVHLPTPLNHRPSIKHHVSSNPTLSHHPTETFIWQEHKWHVISNIYDPPEPRRKISDNENLKFYPPAPSRRKRAAKKRNVSRKFRLSNSSTDSGWFSRDAEETETLTSSSSEVRKNSHRRGNTPARLSSFKRMIPCTVDGKVKESYAIVKKSTDPYEDFKNSMMDMILEKQMYEAKELEQLLQCFLSLNSRCYHETIVRAFSDIWEALFLSPVC